MRNLCERKLACSVFPVSDLSKCIHQPKIPSNQRISQKVSNHILQETRPRIFPVIINQSCPLVPIISVLLTLTIYEILRQSLQSLGYQKHLVSNTSPIQFLSLLDNGEYSQYSHPEP